MIEIRDNKLVIDDLIVGDENKIVEICEKAVKYDELKANFKDGETL